MPCLEAARIARYADEAVVTQRAREPRAAVARALLAKQNPVLEAMRAQERAEGRIEAMTSTILALLARRGISVDDAARTRVLAQRDVSTLARWIELAVTCASVDDLLSS